MLQIISAVYENGVFRPTQSIPASQFKAGHVVQIQIETVPEADSELQKRVRAIEEFESQVENREFVSDEEDDYRIEDWLRESCRLAGETHR